MSSLVREFTRRLVYSRLSLKRLEETLAEKFGTL